MKIRTAAIYCHGEDISYQAGMTVAFCLDRQLRTYGLYYDHGDGRKAWKKLIEENPWLDAVVVLNLDVLKNILLDKMIPEGLLIIGAEDLSYSRYGLDGLENLDATDDVDLETMQDGSEEKHHSSEHKERIKWSEINTKAEKKLLGLSEGFVPYGYYREHGKLILDPNTASVVRLIFEKAKEGLGYTEIASWLKQNGVAAPRSNWTDNTVRWILANDIYTGERVEIIDGEEIVTSKHEAIISRELYDAVNTRTGRNHAEKRERGIFQGMVFCDACKRPMAYQGVGGKAGRKTAIYSCKYHTGANPKEAPLDHMPKIEETVLVNEVIKQCDAYLQSLETGSSKLDSVIEKRAKERSDLERKIRELGEKILREDDFSDSVYDTLWSTWEHSRRQELAASGMRYLVHHRLDVFKPEELDQNNVSWSKWFVRSITVDPDGKVSVKFVDDGMVNE